MCRAIEVGRAFDQEITQSIDRPGQRLFPDQQGEAPG
jgi:hypothetical protein